MLALRYTGRRKEAQNSYPIAEEAQSQSAGTIQSSRPAQQHCSKHGSVCQSKNAEKDQGNEQGAQKYTNADMDLAFDEEKGQ